MVSTPRCGRGNPGSNPGYGSIFILIKVGSDETRHLFGTRVGNFNFMVNHLIALICVYYGFKYVKFCYLFVYVPTNIILYVTWHYDLNHTISSKKRDEKGKFKVAVFWHFVLSNSQIRIAGTKKEKKMHYIQLFKFELNFWEKNLYFWTILMRKIIVRQLQVHSVYCPAFG